LRKAVAAIVEARPRLCGRWAPAAVAGCYAYASCYRDVMEG
jgi:hypothetical protein